MQTVMWVNNLLYLSSVSAREIIYLFIYLSSQWRNLVTSRMGQICVTKGKSFLLGIQINEGETTDMSESITQLSNNYSVSRIEL